MSYTPDKKTYTYALCFFTTWVLILVLTHGYSHQYFDLPYLTFTTMFVGLYLSFVNPRKFVFYFEDQKYTYTGLEKFIIVDMFFHILVFFYICSKYRSHSMLSSQMLNSMLLLLIYTVIMNLEKIYGISFYELLLVAGLGNIVYLIYKTF